MCDNGLQLAYLNQPTVNGINLPDLLITLSAYQNYRRIRNEKLPRPIHHEKLASFAKCLFPVSNGAARSPYCSCKISV